MALNGMNKLLYGYEAADRRAEDIREVVEDSMKATGESRKNAVFGVRKLQKQAARRKGRKT